MLHGYGQTAEKFKSASANVRKVLGSQFEYVYLDAPHPVIDLKGEAGYGWWTLDEEGILGTKSYNVDVEKMKIYNPVGVVGFSQGGVCAYILSLSMKLDFCICIGAYAPLDPQWLGFEGCATNTKYLVVYGEKDTIVKPELSVDLYTKIKGTKKIVSHPKTHVVPKLKEYKWVL